VLDAAILWLVCRRRLAARTGAGIRPSDLQQADIDSGTPAGEHSRRHPEQQNARRITAGAIARAIDWRLLLLFAGLFVVVGAASRAGIDRQLFELLAPIGLRTTGGLAATTALLSNVVSNVPAVMLFTAVIPRLPDPHRAWLTLAMASTLAGNLTILGSIANLIVVEGALRRGVVVSFWDYAKVGIPLTAATLMAGIWWLS
jgi:Na+/H+ antiporter NhaD/arsenite permease-like protein